jgi:hypothetical protein
MLTRMWSTARPVLLWGALIMMFLAVWQYLSPEGPPVVQVAFSEMMAQAHADHDREPYVESAAIKGRQITFAVKDPKTQVKARRMAVGPEQLDAVVQDLIDHGVRVAFEADAPPSTPTAWLVSGVSVVAAAYAAWLAARARREAARANDRAARLEAELGRLGEQAVASPPSPGGG